MSFQSRLQHFKDHFPERPTWRMVNVILFFMFAGAVLVFVVLSGMRGSITSLEENNDTLTTEVATLQEGIDALAAAQEAGRERGFINRGVACMSLIVDNDRTFPLTEECLDSDIAKYYPEQVCDLLPVVVQGCGSQSNPEE